MASNTQTIKFNAKGVAKLKKQYKDLERRTRKFEKSTRGGSGALGGMVAKLGLTTAALYGATKAISGIIKVGAGFEKTMSNLRAISGATGEQMKALEKNARDLGATTVFTATQVGELSVEFAKLGFSSKQIKAVTKDTLALAAASGSDLATAASVAGQTLRAFGMNAEEMSKVTDTMAAAFSGSALDMDKFTNSMQYVAPVAKAVGFSVEGTTALLGGLANAGISGSMAGTALRTVFLKLADSNSALSKKLGGSVKSADDLIPALNDLKNEGVDLTEMLGLVDKRAVSAFKVLLDGTDDVAELKVALDNSAGAAQRMADIQLDNLAGKTTLLGSAMEGLGISLFDHLAPSLNSAVTGMTNLVNSMNSYMAIPTSEKLITEQTEYNALIGMLKDATTSQDGRNTAVATLQKNYPNYIKNIDLESASTDQLNKLLKESNATFEEKIKLQASEEMLAKASRAATAARIEATEAEIKYNNLLAEGKKTVVDYGDGIIEVQSHAELFADAKNRLVRIAEQEADKYAELRKSLGDLGVSYDESGTDVEEYGKKATDAFTKVTEKITETADAVVVLTDAQRANLESDWHRQYTEAVEGTYGLESDAIDATMKRYAQVETDKTKLTEVESSLRHKLHMKTAKMVASSFANSMQTMADAGMVGQTTAKRFAQVQALVDAYASANASYKAMAGIPVVGPGLGIAAAAAALGAGLANVAMIEKAETGFDGVVNRPTMFMTGEGNKSEHVSVTPLEGPNINGPQVGGGITVNISGGVVDDSYVRNELIPALNKATSMGSGLA